MVDFKYLYRGVCGLANAHQAGAMAGHLGAAVTTGYFIGEDQPDLPAEVFRGVEGELDLVIAGEEAIWFKPEEAGVTPTQLFDPLPAAEPDESLIPRIAEALQENVGPTRQSGHNVIFASIALRALHDHPQYATPPIVEGICKLIRTFNGAHPGRGYYGDETGWRRGNEVELPADADLAEYHSIQDLVAATTDELIRTAPLRKQGFGGLWHIINHAAAITELDRFGYKDLARQALPGHHQHILLWRTLPNVEAELGIVPKAEHDPWDTRYWEGYLKRDAARLTHRIKTMYGFHTLMRLVAPPRQRDAGDAFLYLMANKEPETKGEDKNPADGV